MSMMSDILYTRFVYHVNRYIVDRVGTYIDWEDMDLLDPWDYLDTAFTTEGEIKDAASEFVDMIIYDLELEDDDA